MKLLSSLLIAGASAAKCNPDVANWMDTDNQTCEEMKSENYCTSDGKHGSSWDASWGKIEDYISNGYHGFNCPQCGCVDEEAAPAPVVSAATCMPDPDWTDLHSIDCSSYASKSYCTADGAYDIDWNLDRSGKTWFDFEWDGFTGLNCPECGCVEAPEAPTVVATAVPCNPEPASWSDSDDLTCRYYASDKMCTTDGDYGSGWNLDRQGKTFADYENKGYTGLNCKDCGCGKAAPTPVVTEPATTVCPSSECWSYDESTHTCTMTGEGCASLSCGATGFMITFPSTLYNLDDDQVPATFSGGLSPKWDGSKWSLNVALGQNGMTYNLDATTDVITFELPLIMVGNEMKKRSDEIQDNIISLGSQSVVTTPFGAAVIFSCGYDSTINVASQDYTVSGASVVDTFHATGSLADGFAMTLNDGAAASFLLGSNLPVAITWSVTALAAKLSFQITDCTVEHGATAIMVAKGGCYASTLDVVSDGTDQAFAFPVFKGTGETDANQLIRCQVAICEVGQCSAPLSCPTAGDDMFYNYSKFVDNSGP